MVQIINECDSSYFFQVPLLDDYEDRQSYVQAPTRGRGSSEKIDEENRSSQANKSNRERLIENLRVRPVTTTPEPVTITRRTTKEQVVVKKTKYAPITRYNNKLQIFMGV